MDPFFRSATMCNCQIYLPKDMAYNCFVELGELGMVELRDLNDLVLSTRKTFYEEIVKCEAMENKLRFIKSEITKSGYEIKDTGEFIPCPLEKELEDLENAIDHNERKITEVKFTLTSLLDRQKFYKETLEVIEKSEIFLDQEIGSEAKLKDDHDDITVKRIVGVIPASASSGFELMLWRITRGNVYVKIEDMAHTDEDRKGGEAKPMRFFAVCYHGEEIHQKVMKICDGFKAKIYDPPMNIFARTSLVEDINEQLEDLKQIIELTREHYTMGLMDVRQEYRTLHAKVLKMKAIYYRMNFCDGYSIEKYYIAEGWIPADEIENVRFVLNKEAESRAYPIKPIVVEIRRKGIPPTFHPTNKFTRGFQNIIDAYGIASYGEINPAPYTIITFPFFFSVMFGDVGHGAIMAGVASWMIIYEDKLPLTYTSEIFSLLFGGRYIILLMGIFSIYTGFIYNDLFSKSINIFGSHWGINKFTWKDWLATNSTHMLDPATSDYKGYPYIFGTDPVWPLAENEIPYMNVFKMKVSIILGVMHMLFGLYLSFKNSLYIGDYFSIYCELIPMLLFLSCMFVYLCFLIFFKWIIFYANSRFSSITYSERCAPSILITYINMVLLKSAKTNPICEPFMYPGQSMTEHVLLGISALCVPWLLLTKPVITFIAKRSQRQMRRLSFLSSQSLQHVHNTPRVSVAVPMEPTEESTTDIFIHQAIHTIEYVLGCVSHTASYLRLWALSLAHNQLSAVLWNMVLVQGLKFHSIALSSAVTVLTFYAWAFLTISILVLMEGLSAFLHTLRLHWVEFQSKFYMGMGRQFQPFNFDDATEFRETKGKK